MTGTLDENITDVKMYFKYQILMAKKYNEKKQLTIMGDEILNLLGTIKLLRNYKIP